jgi:hypothetical protein
MAEFWAAGLKNGPVKILAAQEISGLILTIIGIPKILIHFFRWFGGRRGGRLAV